MVRMTFWCFYELSGGAIQEDVVSFAVELPTAHTVESFHRWVCRELESALGEPLVPHDTDGDEWPFYRGTVRAFITDELGWA